MSEALFRQTLERFRQFDEVDAITLGGSRASGKYDSTSDYDLYVYLNDELSIEKRKNALTQTCMQMNLGRTYWGDYWDDCILNSGVAIEFTYVSLCDKEKSLRNTLEQYAAGGGYTTCECFVVFNAQILYDPRGLYSSMVKRLTMPYPEPLRKNIVTVNKELMEGVTPSYLNQIEKAVKRGDFVSVNHRLTEFLKCYFDILFALNRCFHPGEKRLMAFAVELCEQLPVDFETDMQELFAAYGDERMLPVLHKLLNRLNDLIDRCL